MYIRMPNVQYPVNPNSQQKTTTNSDISNALIFFSNKYI